MNTCRNCNRKIEDDALVCPYCGCVVKKGSNRGANQSAQSVTRSSVNNGGVSDKKRKTWLWIIGWIFIFPIPLTILMLRNQKFNKIAKIAIIAAAWVIYLIIASSMGRSSGNATKEKQETSINESKKDSSGNIKKLEFSKDEEVTVKGGESVSPGYLKVSVKSNDDFSTDDVIFVSVNPEIAEISFSHDALTTWLYFDITGVDIGETDVYAMTPDGSVQSERIHVVVPEVLPKGKINSLEFTDEGEVTVKVGMSESPGYLKVSVKAKEDFSPDDIVFVSENPDVAKIEYSKDSWGAIYFDIIGVNGGETNVYAKSAENESVQSGKIHVVVPEPIRIESIDLGEVKTELTLGENEIVNATISPSDAEDRKLTWSSSDEAVATVNEEGKVVAVGGGTATIKAASSNGVEASFDVNVDATKRLMNVRARSDRLNGDVNIGEDWSKRYLLNGEPTHGSVGLAVGETLTFEAEIIESDDDPDIGSASTEYTVTEEDLVNGFEISFDVTVTENGGRNSGQSALFTVTYTFTPN